MSNARNRVLDYFTFLQKQTHTKLFTCSVHNMTLNCRINGTRSIPSTADSTVVLYQCYYMYVAHDVSVCAICRTCNTILKLCMHNLQISELNLTLTLATSNMTGCHRGLKRKLRAGYRAPSLQCTSYLCLLLLCVASSINHCQVWYHALSLCMCMLCTYSPFGIILAP